MALTYREALVPEPMGIMEKSATIMNDDLGGESIEGFGGGRLAGLMEGRSRGGLIARSICSHLAAKIYLFSGY